MSELISWLALGVSGSAMLGSWVDFIFRRRDARRSDIIKREMNDHTQILAEATARLISQQDRSLVTESPGRATEAQSGNGDVAQVVDWKAEDVGGMKWKLRNIGSGTASNIVVEASAEVESLTIDGPATSTPMGAVEVTIRPKWRKPLPDSLLVSWDGHPEPVEVPLPRWFLR